MKDNKLKPGDRVRLTGWAKQNPSIELLLHEDGVNLPVECIIERTDFEGELHVLDGWNILHFTYEKIQDDGNG